MSIVKLKELKDVYTLWARETAQLGRYNALLNPTIKNNPITRQLLKTLDVEPSINLNEDLDMDMGRDKLKLLISTARERKAIYQREILELQDEIKDYPFQENVKKAIQQMTGRMEMFEGLEIFK